VLLTAAGLAHNIVAVNVDSASPETPGPLDPGGHRAALSDKAPQVFIRIALGSS